MKLLGLSFMVGECVKFLLKICRQQKEALRFKIKGVVSRRSL